MTTTESLGMNHRSLAFLRAVAAGRCELSISAEPDLFIDGLSCGDQPTAHCLAHRGYLAPGRIGHFGEHVPALLTAAGRQVLGN